MIRRLSLASVGRWQYFPCVYFKIGHDQPALHPGPSGRDGQDPQPRQGLLIPSCSCPGGVWLVCVCVCVNMITIMCVCLLTTYLAFEDAGASL